MSIKVDGEVRLFRVFGGSWKIPLLGLIYVVTGHAGKWREKLANKTLERAREREGVMRHNLQSAPKECPGSG